MHRFCLEVQAPSAWLAPFGSCVCANCLSFGEHVAGIHAKCVMYRMFRSFHAACSDDLWICKSSRSCRQDAKTTAQTVQVACSNIKIKFSLKFQWKYAIWWGPQGRASGRLLSYNPATRKTHVVTEGLWFANGVTLSKDESFVAVVETNVQRVHRVWVSGPKVRLWALWHLINVWRMPLLT